jgi:hypothetical protein
MSRLNLTLDADTLGWIERCAAREKMAVAAFARLLLRETVQHREERARRKKLAADFADGRELLRDLERPQLEGLLDDA